MSAKVIDGRDAARRVRERVAEGCAVAVEHHDDRAETPGSPFPTVPQPPCTPPLEKSFNARSRCAWLRPP